MPLSSKDLEQFCTQVWREALAQQDVDVGGFPAEVRADLNRVVRRAQRFRKRTPPQVITPNETRFGRYSNWEEIGQGGMGKVYRARDTLLDRDVAIKELLPGQSTERFLHEAQVLAKLRCENLVHVYDFGESTTGTPFIEMEWVEGNDLAWHISHAGGPLDEEQVVPWMRDVCQGLIAAASAGVVHRDLKPSNILIEEKSQRGRVADFGLALAPHGNSQSAALVVGTPRYMSPEQSVDSNKVDTRSDVYSFGATFYHALTGQPPFESDSIPELFMKHANEPLVSPASINGALSQRISDVLERCMAKDSSERFQSFAEILPQLSMSDSLPSPWDDFGDELLVPHLTRYRPRREQYLEAQLEDVYEFSGGRRLTITHGDITEQPTDAIASSDDSALSMGGGVSSRIARAAGQEMVCQAKMLTPVRPGRVAVTTAGDLQARFVFHGITIGRGVAISRDLITEILRSCFYHADTLYLNSLALPLLGTGTAMFSREVCLDTMFRVVARMLAHGITSVRDVRIVIYEGKEVLN